MKTVQRLNDYDSLKRFSIENSTPIGIADVSLSSWTMSGGTLLFTGKNYYVSTHYVIEASPDSIAPITVSLDASYAFEEEDNGADFVFSCVVFCAQTNITVEAKLYDELGVAVDGVTKSVQAGVWTAVRSNVFTKTATEDPTLYRIVLTVSGHNSNTVKISTTNLVNDSTWASNPVIQSIGPYMPGFYESYDRKEENPQYPFMRFIDVITDSIADTMFIYSEWFQYDAAEIIPGDSKQTLSTRSRLTNYEAVYEENVEWLSQFSGSKIKKQLYVDGNPIVTDTANFQKSQLFPAIYGRGAGTQGAIKEAVGYVLTDTKTVVIGQRAGGDPWVMKVVTLIDETPGVDAREDVRLATVFSIDITLDLQAGSTIDGRVLVAGDRVLAKNQEPPVQNGVYVVQSSGSAVRSTDTFSLGATFYVLDGVLNKRKAFEVITPGTITIDDTPFYFGQFSGSKEVLAVAEPARPLGYSLKHEIVREFTLTLGDLEFGILGTATL